MLLPFRLLLRGALRDRTSLMYAVAFPVGALVGLGLVFPTASYRHLLLIGMVALSTLFFSLSGGAYEAISQRNSGLYKLLRVTPYRTLPFIASLAAARGMVALLSSAVVAVVGMVIFGMPLHWQSIFLLLPVLLCGTLCFTFLGLFVSNLAQNAGQVAMLTNVLTLPMIFAAETFYSLSGAPVWVRVMGQWFPLSHLIAGVRFALAGNDAGIVGPLLALSAFTLTAIVLATSTFRWDDQQPLPEHLAKAVRERIGRLFSPVAPIPAFPMRGSQLGKERDKNRLLANKGAMMTARLRAVVQAASQLSPEEQDKLANQIAPLLTSGPLPAREGAVDCSGVADVLDDAGEVRERMRHAALPTPSYEES